MSIVVLTTLLPIIFSLFAHCLYYVKAIMQGEKIYQKHFLYFQVIGIHYYGVNLVSFLPQTEQINPKLTHPWAEMWRNCITFWIMFFLKCELCLQAAVAVVMWMTFIIKLFGYFPEFWIFIVPLFVQGIILFFIFNFVKFTFSGSLPQSLRSHAQGRKRWHCPTVQRSSVPEWCRGRHVPEYAQRVPCLPGRTEDRLRYPLEDSISRNLSSMIKCEFFRFIFHQIVSFVQAEKGRSLT